MVFALEDALTTANKVYFCKVGLTNRFHVAVRPFSYRSQMTSKYGKEQKSGTRSAGECFIEDICEPLPFSFNSKLN